MIFEFPASVCVHFDFPEPNCFSVLPPVSHPDPDQRASHPDREADERAGAGSAQHENCSSGGGDAFTPSAASTQAEHQGTFWLVMFVSKELYQKPTSYLCALPLSR